MSQLVNFVGCAAAACALAAAAPAAHAQGHRRVFGVGTVVGGGASYNVLPALYPPRVDWGPQADFGTLELRFFLRHGGSIDVYSQLGNTLVSAITAAVPRRPDEPGALVFASLGVLYNFNVNLWRRRVFLLLAPGLELGGDLGVGGAYERTHPVKAAVRVPLRVGVEWLDHERTFGLQFMVRAFAEVLGYARHADAQTIVPGAAALAEVGLIAY